VIEKNGGKTSFFTTLAGFPGKGGEGVVVPSDREKKAPPPLSSRREVSA